MAMGDGTGDQEILELFQMELGSRLQDIAWQDGPGKYNWNDAMGLAVGADPTGPPDVYGCLYQGDWVSGNAPLADAWAEAWGACVQSGDVESISIEKFREFLAPLLDFGYQWEYTGSQGWHHASDLLSDAMPFSPPNPAGVLDNYGYCSSGGLYCAEVWGMALQELELWLQNQNLINQSILGGE